MRGGLPPGYGPGGLPASGDKAALEKLVGDLMVMPLNRSKPLWDIYLIDGYGNGMAMMFRIHHCIADGIALSRVLLSLTDAVPDATIGHPRDDASRRGRIGAIAAPVKAGVQLAGAGLQEGIEILAHPTTELTSLAKRGSAEARALAKLLMTGPDAKTVLSGKPGVARRVTWSEPMPLQDIKNIGEATGATVNDVLVAAITGTLHSYLSARGSLVEEIRVLVPFNLQPLDRPLPRELGNRFGFAYLTLPVGVADAAGRLAEVHRRMETIKRSPESALSYGILETMGPDAAADRAAAARRLRAEVQRGTDKRPRPTGAAVVRRHEACRSGLLGAGGGHDRDRHQHLQL